MKKFFILITVFFVSVNAVFSQIEVESVGLSSAIGAVGGAVTALDMALATAMGTLNGNIIYQTGKQVYEYAEAANRFAEQVKQWKKEAEQYAKQLQSFKDIKDYSSAMDWYNRSLEMERNMQESFMNPNIQFNGKKYSWGELDQLVNDAEFSKNFNKEYSEEAQKEMWLKLGLTPANYAYVAPYRQKANDLTYEFLAERGLHEKWFAQQMEQSYIRNRARIEDQLKSDAEKLTDKQVLLMISEALDEGNKTINWMLQEQIKVNELAAAERKAAQIAIETDLPFPTEPPKSVFRPLDKKERKKEDVKKSAGF